MISYQRKALFIHLGRTGGSSIESELKNLGFEHPTVELDVWHGERSENSDGSWTLQKASEPKTITSKEKHLTLEEYSLKYNLNNYYKFSIVRNPWSKMLSWYHYHRGMANNKKYDFKQWLSEVISNKCTNNMCSRDKSFERRHFCNQIDSLTIKGEYSMDFVGVFSNLTVDFRNVCNALSVENKELPLLNPNAGASTNNRSFNLDYRRFYDKESEELVRRAFHKDIEYFNFKF